MKKILLALLLLACWCPAPASAQFTSTIGSGGSAAFSNRTGWNSSPDTTTPTTQVNDLLVIVMNVAGTGGGTVTAGLPTDTTGTNIWKQATFQAPTSANTCGTDSHQITGYVFYARATTNSTFTITLTATASVTFTGNWFLYQYRGAGSIKTDPLDVADCRSITTNAATQTSNSMSLLNHDAVNGYIVCASGNVGTGEFAPVSPLISGTAENGGAASSARPSHLIDNTTAGAQTFAYTSAQGCSFATYNLVEMIAAFSSSGPSSGIPMVIKYHRHQQKIPWDRPRRQLELERI